MCSICGYSECPSRCPNAPEPEPVETCACCGTGITAGEAYYRFGGDAYCEDCMKVNGLSILEDHGAVRVAETDGERWII